MGIINGRPPRARYLAHGGAELSRAARLDSKGWITSSSTGSPRSSLAATAGSADRAFSLEAPRWPGGPPEPGEPLAAALPPGHASLATPLPETQRPHRKRPTRPCGEVLAGHLLLLAPPPHRAKNGASGRASIPPSALTEPSTSSPRSSPCCGCITNQSVTNLLNEYTRLTRKGSRYRLLVEVEAQNGNFSWKGCCAPLGSSREKNCARRAPQEANLCILPTGGEPKG